MGCSNGPIPGGRFIFGQCLGLIWKKEIKCKENIVKEVIEQKFSQIDGFTGNVEDSWGKVKESAGYYK